MSYATGVLLAAIAVGIVIAALVELSKYFRGQALISTGQLVLRLIMAALILAVIGLSFWGAVHFRTHPQPLTMALFWALVLVLTIVVIVLALADLHRVQAAQHRVRAEMYQRMADLRRELMEIAEASKSQDDPGPPPEQQP